MIGLGPDWFDLRSHLVLGRSAFRRLRRSATGTRGAMEVLRNFLPQHVAQYRFRNRGLCVRQILPQRLVHHRLVAVARLLGARPKGVEHGIVNKDRDPRLALLRQDRASLAFRKIVVSSHEYDDIYSICTKARPGG